MSLKNLTSKDTLIVLTFAKAGLGHLRVAYALMDGLPKEARVVLFSTRDEATTFMHRLTSVNPVARELAEALQYGIAERIFTAVYTRVLRLRAKSLLPQIEATIGNLKPRPKRVIFVATHFGLAHQLGELKHALSLSGVDVKLVVVVTDDSPQRAWSVPNADLTIVPSRLTELRLKAPNSKVVHYPLSLKLGHELKKSKLEYKFKQADPESKVKIKMSLPVSGAAVGLDFYTQLALKLKEVNNRFAFYITSRDSAYTKDFLNRMENLEIAKVYKYEYDRLVVANYHKVIKNNTVLYEVTKPSEQAFKALYAPHQLGGVILLFTQPVGRQEYDNMWFLARQRLIPSKEDQERLWQMSNDKLQITNDLLKKAKGWRGVRLMSDPKKSALFIEWCLKEGVFEQMMRFEGKAKSNGVQDTWRLVDHVGRG